MNSEVTKEDVMEPKKRTVSLNVAIGAPGPTGWSEMPEDGEDLCHVVMRCLNALAKEDPKRTFEGRFTVNQERDGKVYVTHFPPVRVSALVEEGA